MKFCFPRYDYRQWTKTFAWLPMKISYDCYIWLEAYEYRYDPYEERRRIGEVETFIIRCGPF